LRGLIFRGSTAILLFLSVVASAQVDTEFWFVVPELSHRGNTGGTPGTLRIATLELPATVTISMPANPYHPTLNPGGFQDIVVDIAANSTAAVNLTPLLDVAANPANNRLENKPLTINGINDFGLHITSTNMITCYWEVNYAYGSDLWTLKGHNAEGTLFYTPFQTFYNNRNLTPRTYSAIDIVATTDNTQVTITLPPGKAASFGSLLTTIPAGGTYSLTLNRGQTFSVFPLNYSIFVADRLAGTRIESTENICVTVKDDALAVSSQGQDVIGDQIVPVDIVGSHYIVPDMGNPNHVYVLATEDNTPIYVFDGNGVPIGPSPYVTLNRGQQALVVVPGGSKFGRITSTLNPADPPKPFYTFQLGVENQARGGALVPSIGCTGNTQLAFTRARDENKFQFFIIVSKGNEDKFLVDGIRQDGIIDPGAFTEIPGSGGYMAWFSNSININTLPIGQHLVENTGDIFHLGIFNGFPGAGQGGLYYGYYSDFGGLNIGANVAGTNSVVVRACYGDPVQLFAYGGTDYLWSPDTYLDDATSNLPTAIDLPPGPHNYSVEISGACATGTRNLTVIVSTPVRAFFNTNAQSGCSPLEINFEDQSEGAFSWQYMIDGTTITYDLDPVTPYQPPPGYPAPFTISHTYTNYTNAPVTDTVTLLVKNESGCADIFTKTIVVYPEVYSDFSIDGATRGCDPLHVDFVNNSSGNTDTWFWEFGDGGSSIEQEPEHTYRNLFGPDSIVYEARLIAISPYYCRDTSTQTVTVMPYIEANFVFDTVFACTPHDIIISDQSFGADYYFWDFGNGTTSTSPGPVIPVIYVNNTDSVVTYTVRLRVENDEGCSDEISREVTVFPEIRADFTPDRIDGCSPFDVAFQNNSSGAAAYLWDFGDGGTSSLPDPVHLYDRNMTDHDTTYVVTLIATSAEFCTDTAVTVITVHPYIEALFAVDDIVGCHPFEITVSDLSTGADEYIWDFGDGTPALLTSSPTLTHTYLNTGNGTAYYDLMLIVRNSEGCTDTLVRTITVYPEITANFTASAFDGCHPLEVTFTNLSLNAMTYYWDFGDGSSSAEFSPVHTFTNFGMSDVTYQVTLVVSTGNGECVKSISWPITVHGNVAADFALPVASGCSPFEAVIENRSNGGDTYHWDFGDGSDTLTNDLLAFRHTFVNTDFSNTRTFDIRLVAENNAGCTDTVHRTITVLPDISASFTASPADGCHPLDVIFTNLSQGASSYMWDFGDGTSSFIQDPIHTYNNRGDGDTTYIVTLRAYSPDNSCSSVYSSSITVHPEINAGFTIPVQSGCNPFTVTLYNNSAGGDEFHWVFGDGTDTVTYNTDPIEHLFINTDFNNPETFEIILTAFSSSGCSSEYTRTVVVEPAITAGMAADITEGCHPLPVTFTNTSQGGYTYVWDFGDGTSSGTFSPTHTFSNFTDSIVTRHVLLTATSVKNCISTVSMDVTVHPKPKALFETDKVIDCPPSTFRMNNSSLNADLYAWNFGDGSVLSVNNTDPVDHVFDNQGNQIAAYIIRLTASTSYGCVDSTMHTVNIYPATRADFTMNDEGCSPLTSSFINESELGDSYLWDFGDGTLTSVKDPSHIYFNFSDRDTTYMVSLMSSSRYGCTDIKTDSVHVYPQPVAEFIALPTHQIFPQATVTLTNATNQGPWTYLWDMGDGSSLTGETPSPYTYSQWGEFEIRLSVSSDHCTDDISHTIRIFPAPPIAKFDTIIPGCEPHTVTFTNTSLYGDTYLWDFDDGSTSTEYEPAHTFVESGIYNVKLTVTGEGGRDYYYRQVEVYPDPVVEFRISPLLVMLPDQSIQLYNLSENGNTYLWDFGDGTNSTEVNPSHLYTEVGIYDITLDVWTEHGCSGRLIKPDAVTVVGKGLMVFPNAFMPDQMGPNGGYYNLNEPEKNNIFHPYWEGVDIYNLQIFNRWGMLIYESRDVMKGWDGYYQENLSKQGVYVWKCTGTFTNGQPYSLVGDVTLLYGP
jgi:PKD repeat protein